MRGKDSAPHEGYFVIVKQTQNKTVYMGTYWNETQKKKKKITAREIEEQKRGKIRERVNRGKKRKRKGSKWKKKYQKTG